MRKWVSILTLAAFVLGMNAPVHAMPVPGSHKASQVATAEMPCHHDMHKAAGDKQAANQKSEHEGCCDNGICKCPTGFCHGGFTQLMGAGNASLFVSASTGSQFTFTDETAASALTEGLKRPPKA